MVTPKELINLVGGRETVPITVNHARDLINLVRTGLPTAAIDHLLAQQWLTLTELDRIVISRKTLHHRRQSGQLTAEQSDRLLRVVRIFALAEDTFGSRDKALLWLRRPNRVLDDEAPLELLDTETGARQVETLLGRIAHGIAA